MWSLWGENKRDCSLKKTFVLLFLKRTNMMFLHILAQQVMYYLLNCPIFSKARNILEFFFLNPSCNCTPLKYSVSQKLETLLFHWDVIRIMSSKWVCSAAKYSYSVVNLKYIIIENICFFINMPHWILFKSVSIQTYKSKHDSVGMFCICRT